MIRPALVKIIINRYWLSGFRKNGIILSRYGVAAKGEPSIVNIPAPEFVLRYFL